MPLRVAYQQQTSVSQSGMPRAQATPVVDPGNALQKFAGEIATYGKELYQAQREADLQDRIGKATAELSTLELDFERDQDFRTSPQRFNEASDAIRDKYLDGVNDAAVATAFRKQYGNLALSKSLNVRKASFAKEKDYNVASLDSNIDVYATSAANAKNPAEALIVENQARIAIASSQANGWITAEEAGKRERTFLGKRDTAVVLRDLSIDPALTATKLSLDPTYAGNIDPVQRERLVANAYSRADTQQRQADAAAEKARKARGDELLKDAYSRGEKGALTRAYVEEIKPFVEPHEYKSLLKSLGGEDRKDNPTAFAELQGLVYTNPQEAERRAFLLHRNGQIRNETLYSTLSRAREIGRSEGPRTEYERSRQYITNAIKPSDMVPDPAASARYAVVLREFDDFANSGKRTDDELRKKSDELLERYTMVNMVELARRTASGAQRTPQDQLKAIDAEEAQLVTDFETKKITKEQFNRKADTLKKARAAAQRAASNGGK
jgi:hypothetical protein